MLLASAVRRLSQCGCSVTVYSVQITGQIRNKKLSYVVQGHSISLMFVQSKARMRLPLVNDTNLHPVLHRIDQITAFDSG